MKVAFEEDSLIALKGKRGSDLRTLFNELSLYVDMDSVSHIVKIKGEEDCPPCMSRVREFFKAHSQRSHAAHRGLVSSFGQARRIGR